MKNQEFEVNLLIHQNSEMVQKLQFYRRENQELSSKNENLNCWVQNLSEVFASISAAWSVITDNQEALYTLMKKKSDAASKQMIAKYISHFRAFDEIVSNLGDKITNQGHSGKASQDAKERLSSFVNNYKLFFQEFVDVFSRFNEEYISMIQEKLKEPNLSAQMRQIANQSLENRQKIKDFEEFMNKIKDGYKQKQTNNQHQLLDGIIMKQVQEIEQLKDQNLKLARRISFMTDYNVDNVDYVLKNENFECFCGGAHLKYYNKIWEQKLKNQGNTLSKKQSQNMMDEQEEIIKNKLKELGQLQIEKQILVQRNVQVLAKCQKIKSQNKLTDQFVLQSPLYLHLRSQFRDLIQYTNDLTHKLHQASDYLNQIEKSRLDEINQLKAKYQKNSNGSNGSKGHPSIVGGEDISFLVKFKENVDFFCSEIRTKYHSINQSIKGKEESLLQTKESLKYLKKQNEDLNRRLADLQQRQLKSIQNLEYRHQRFNDVEKVINQMFKNAPHNQQLQKNRRVWHELVEYTKTRDKKIKAMEQMIKRKQKQLVQKQKVEEVIKSALNQTEQIYQKYKQKLNTFEQFMSKIQKQIINLSQQNYKLKIQSQQQKNMLNIRLKNELEVKNKLEQKVKNIMKIEEEIKITKQQSIDLQKKILDLKNSEREKSINLQLELKEKQREIKLINEYLTEKEKNIEKLIQDKEKKNLEISKLQIKKNSIESESELKKELEEYKYKIMCRCGAEREREIVLKTCPHIFCKKCIEDTTANRNRKCPICGVRFTKTDIHEIVWS